jgi:SAM-dependent methyltransferase
MVEHCSLMLYSLEITMTNNVSTICPSCDSKTTKFIGNIPCSDFFAGKHVEEPINGGGLFSCLTCHCFFRYPRLPKEELDALYRCGDEENWTPSKTEERTDWQIAYSWIQGHTEAFEILDVGCFSGEFLKGLNGDAACHGVEIHQKAADRARKSGVNIIGDDFDALIDINNLFDIVTSFDVIEHVYNPKAFLKILSGVTKPNGEIIISTGNTMAPSWRLMGSRYWYCGIGEHISFINPDWCEMVANECGLELSGLEYFSHAGPSRSTLTNRLKEIGANMAYRFLPFILHYLRKCGVGGRDVKKYHELLDSPPIWSTAKDHFIVKFRKTG